MLQSFKLSYFCVLCYLFSFLLQDFQAAARTDSGLLLKNIPSYACLKRALKYHSLTP